jgi:hypothetical protein
MAMTEDEIGLETEIADLLDDIAGELNGIAEQLRRKPFAAVQEQIKHQLSRLGSALRDGQDLRLGPSPLVERITRWLTGESYEV